MTATYNPAEVERLIAETREALADLDDPDHGWLTANGADVIDQLEAARAEIKRLQAEANRLDDKRWRQPWEPK